MPGLRRISEWKSDLAAPASAPRRQLRRIYGSDDPEIHRRLGLWSAALDGFAATYGQGPVLIARACGRANLLGMHIDHRGGAVNALGVGDTILVVQPRQDDLVLLANADPQFASCRFRIRHGLPDGGVDDWDHWTIQQYQKRLADGTQADWSNYVRAAVLYLQHIHTAPGGRFAPPIKGMNVFVAGNVPPRSGLSSSSSIVMATMEACIALNDLNMSDMDMVEAGRLAEWYVGTRGGGGDHAAIKFCQQGRLAHLGAFPLTVDMIRLPDDFCAVLCDSMVVAAKTAGARDLFNQRVACYELGMLMLRKAYPELATKMKLLRDVNPISLGVDEAAIYRMLKALPTEADRDQISGDLADVPDRVEQIFRSHEPAGEVYRIRQACLYGIAECLRSRRGAELLRAGDLAGFGELVSLSHDGDRVTRLVDGRRLAVTKNLSDEELDRLIRDVVGGDRRRREAARLYRQPGGYDASCPQLDELVDIAMDTPGVLGAGLVGAGLGGSIVVLVRRADADAVVRAVDEQYYRPRNLPATYQICFGVGGSGVIEAG